MTRRLPYAPATVWALTFFALVGLGAPGAGASQTLPAPSTPLAPVRIAEPAWAGRVEVTPRSRSSVAGVAVALPRGSATDPVGSEGVTWILADAVVRAVEARIGAGRVEGSSRVDPERTTFTFVVRTHDVEATLAAFEAMAFGQGPGSAAVQDALEVRIADLVFQQDSPVREVGRSTRALIYGSQESRVHAPGGTLGSVESLDEAAVERQRRAAFDPGTAVVTVVGSVTTPAMERTVVADAAGDSTAAESVSGNVPADRPAETAPRPLAGQVPASTPTQELAWTEGLREVVEREVTNTWITVAWPVPADLSRVAVDFVAHRMERELNPSPPDPGVFSATVEVAETARGEVLVVRAAVQPRQAVAMENRILALTETLSTPLDGSFFLWYRRQFRADRLVADAPPEAAARRQAQQILARGSALDVGRDVWELTPETVARTAAALGSPRVLVFGPPGAGN